MLEPLVLCLRLLGATSRADRTGGGPNRERRGGELDEQLALMGVLGALILGTPGIYETGLQHLDLGAIHLPVRTCGRRGGAGQGVTGGRVDKRGIVRYVANVWCGVGETVATQTLLRV